LGARALRLVLKILNHARLVNKQSFLCIQAPQMASTATNTAAEQASEQAKAELYRRLAHNDKAVRDRGVKMLRDFLAKRKNISEIGMMKIWKAVFYCMFSTCLDMFLRNCC
jgi:hypothetical protein